MNKVLVVVAVIVGLIIFIGVFVLVRNFVRSMLSTVSLPNSPTPVITPIPDDGNVNTDNWKEFTSSVFNYSIKYPPEGNIDNPTSDGSEVLTIPRDNLNDGVKLTFKSDNLEENDLMNFVSSSLEKFRNDPVVTYTSEIEPIELANLSGYKFDITTNQSITYIFLQKGQGEYFQIINETSDPNSKGYIDLANEILNTLRVEVNLPEI